MIFGSFDGPTTALMSNPSNLPGVKGSLESDNLMAAMLSSGMSPNIPGRKNSGNSMFDLVEHRSDNELSLLGGGHAIDEIDNSANEEE